MRRIRLVLAVVTVMVAMLAAVSGPAMADVDFDNADFNDNGDFTLNDDGDVFLFGGDFLGFLDVDDNLFDDGFINSDGGVFQSVGNDARSGDVSIGNFVG